MSKMNGQRLMRFEDVAVFCVKP